MKEKDTRELLHILKDTSNKKDLENVLKTEEESFTDMTFAQYFMEKSTAYYPDGTDRAELVKDSGIDRIYCYQILNGTKKPGRDKVIALCLAIHADITTTQKCLNLAGHSNLYSRNKRDAIIIFAVEKKLSVRDTNDLLSEFSESELE